MTTRSRRRPRAVAVGLSVVLPTAVMLIVAVVICMGVTTVTLLLPALRATAAAAVTVTVTTPETCTAHTMQIVAHPDDDLLFLNPDILRDIEAGHCVRTVFVTTGDANRDDSYWPRREDGVRAAYAIMAGADDAWTATTIAIAGNDLTTVTLDAAPAISLVFMRLPDGNRRGTGNRIHDFESLKRLWEGDIPTSSAVDGTATYDRESLQRTLTGLIDDFGAGTVRTQDWTIEFGAGDNADHTATAFFAREAARMSPAEHTLVAYAGYPSWRRAANVSGHDLGAKAAAIVAYAAHDPKMCVEPQCVDAFVASIRAARQYVVAIELVGTVGPPKTLGQVPPTAVTGAHP